MYFCSGVRDPIRCGAFCQTLQSMFKSLRGPLLLATSSAYRALSLESAQLYASASILVCAEAELVSFHLWRIDRRSPIYNTRLVNESYLFADFLTFVLIVDKLDVVKLEHRCLRIIRTRVYYMVWERTCTHGQTDWQNLHWARHVGLAHAGSPQL